MFKTYECIHCGNIIHVDMKEVMESHGCLHCKQCDETFGLEDVAMMYLTDAFDAIEVYVKEVLELDS